MSRIEGPVGVVGGEGLLVGPPGTMSPQLADEAPLGRTKDLAEDLIPGFPHQGQQAGNIPLNHRTLGQHRVGCEPLQVAVLQLVRRAGSLHFPGYEGSQPFFQEVERLPNPFVVGVCHDLLPIEHIRLCRGLPHLSCQAGDFSPAANQGIVSQRLLRAVALVADSEEAVG